MTSGEPGNSRLEPASPDVGYQTTVLGGRSAIGEHAIYIENQIVAAAKPPSPLDVAVPTPRDEGLIGRQDIIDESVARLLGGHSVSLLSGLPGAGKTALAIQIAQDPRVVDHFADGCMWLTVGSREESGLPHWVHRMTTWCQELGVNADQIGSAQSAEDVSRMTQLVHEALNGRQVLLVFDDIWLLEDAVLFSDIGKNCRRLLTTRFPKVAHCFAQAVVKVPELDPVASALLLERHCPGARHALGDRLDPVLQAVSGVPLALVLVGANLRETLQTLGFEAASKFLAEVAHAYLDLSTDQLPPSQRPLAGKHATLRRVIDLTAKRLTAAERDALHALTAFPPKANTFSAPAGRRVAGDPERFTTLTMNGLVELHSINPDRFTLHQAIADFARQDRRGDTEAYRRMTQYFIDYVADSAKDDWSSWIAALAPEADNLRSALQWATEAGEVRLAMRLMAVLWPYWYRTSQFQRARDLAERVLALPDPGDCTREDQVLRSQLLNDTGNYAYNMSDLAGAERLHTAALQIRERLGEQGLCAGSWNGLGLVLRERGDYTAARLLLERALTTNENTRHAKWQLWRAMNLSNLGLTSACLGELDRARDEQRQAVEEFQSLENDWGVAMSRTDLAEVLIEQGQVSEARKQLQLVLPQRAAEGDSKALAAVLRAEAAIELYDEDPQAGCRLLLGAITLAAPVSDRLGEGKALDRLVIAAGRTLNAELAARAACAVQSYQRLTGVRSPERANRARNTTLEECKHRLSAELWAAAYDEAEAAASKGLLYLTEALGSAAVDVDPTIYIQQLLDNASRTEPPDTSPAASTPHGP